MTHGAIQNVVFSWKGDVHANNSDLCIDLVSARNPTQIKLYVCHGMRGNQHFVINRVSALALLQESPLCIIQKVKIHIFV